MTVSQPRPRVVTAAFWCWLVASVMLILGGLIAASISLPTAYRAAAVLTIVAGGAMAFLTGRIRGGDTRYRRAAVALSLTIVVLVAAVSATGVVHIITLLAVLPLIAGAVLVTRPNATHQETS